MEVPVLHDGHFCQNRLSLADMYVSRMRQQDFLRVCYKPVSLMSKK